MKKIILLIALAIIATACSAQTSKVDSFHEMYNKRVKKIADSIWFDGAKTPDTTQKMPDSTFHGILALSNISSPTLRSFGLSSPSLVGRYSFTEMNTGITIIGISQPDPNTGKTMLYMHKSQIHWLSDSTAYIMPYKKPVKHHSKIKHFTQLADGSFYLKELKPGETATLSVKIPVKH